MAHEIEKMAYVGATPWHGLGVRLETPPATVAEALKLAGLDWTVSLVQLQLPNGTKVDQYATVRDSDNAVLGTVGSGFRIVQNEKAFAFFDPFVSTGAANIETAGSLRGGARVWMLAKISRPDSVIVKKADDRVAKYLLLAQGHDGHLSIHVGATPIRVVCQNTLSMAVNQRQAGLMKIRHTTKAEETLQLVQETIERADRDFESAAGVFRELSKKKVTVERLRAYIDAAFPQRKTAKDIVDKQAEAAAKQADAGDGDLLSLLNKPRSKKSDLEQQFEDESRRRERAERRVVDNIVEIFEKGGRAGDLNLPGVKGTAWAAYNAVTEYLTWERGQSADARLNTLWLGGQNNPGVRALEAAQQTFLA